MILLIDLDGTLTDTAHDDFKPMKDGQVAVEVKDIPLIKGAKEFIEWARQNQHLPIIISDSHPNYVKPIAKEIFKVGYLSLADKPNTERTKKLLKAFHESHPNHVPNIDTHKDDFIVIGDTWLDIEMGRSLNCKTVLARFYRAKSNHERDGIGDTWRHLKSGPTYMVDTFDRIKDIIQAPTKCLLAAEAIFHGQKTKQSRKYKTETTSNGLITSFVSLGRQQAGECDKYAIANKYFEFQREDRSEQTVKLLANAVENYVDHVILTTKGFNWDYLTYVSDKKTTIPPNKMSALIDQIIGLIPKIKVFGWRDDVSGSIRNQINFADRRNFVTTNFYVETSVDLKGKNVIVIDDQFTTGGTAFAVRDMLREKGVNNFLFVTLFNLITTVQSERTCPHCGTRLQVKINRQKGTKFLSCVAPKYNGTGCGNFIENIN